MANELRKILRVDQISNSTFKVGLGANATTFVTSADNLSIDKTINLNNKTVTGLAVPVNGTDAATKDYVDGAINTAVADAAITVTDGVTPIESVDTITVAGSGDIKAVTAAGTAGEVIVTVSHEIGESTYTGNSGATVIQDVKKSADGHVTEVQTVELTPAIIGAQPAAAELTGIVDMSTGIVVKSADDTMVAREITGTGAITVTNGTGVDGNPEITVAAASITSPGVVQLSNDLLTDSSTMALTAAQGKVLKDTIDAETAARGEAIEGLRTDIEAQISEITSDLAAVDVQGEGAISVDKAESIFTVSVANATTDTAGVVKLNDTLTSDATNEALTAAQGKALKAEVDAKLALAGGTMTGVLTLAGAPNGDNDAATKAYVDSVAEGLNIHAEVAVATTEPITLTGLQTIDGYAVQEDDRVLVKDQANAVENGIYVAHNDAWVRATDCDEDVELTKCYVFVGNGATYAGFGFSQIGQATVGSTEVTWTIFSRATKYSVVAGDGSAINVSAEGSKFTVDIATASTSTAGVVKLNDTLTSDATNEALTAAQGKALKDAIDAEVTARGEAITDIDNSKIEKMSGAVAGNLVVATVTGEVEDAGVKVAVGELAETTDLVSGAQVKTYVDTQIALNAPKTVIVPVAMTLGTEATYTSTVSVPAGAYIESVNLIIETPYEGSGVTISASVGETTVIDSTWNDPMTAGDYEGNSNVFTMGQSTINVVIAGAPTAGAAKLIVKYSAEVQA